MLSCSHKKNALNFLDNFCSFYEQKYIFASSKAAENTQAFLDTVYELAEANGLPSNTFKSALTELSIDQLRKHLNKVCYCCYLASRYFYSSVLATGLFIYLFLDVFFFLDYNWSPMGHSKWLFKRRFYLPLPFPLFYFE